MLRFFVILAVLTILFGLAGKNDFEMLKMEMEKRHEQIRNDSNQG
jgi:hypothetical protein